MKAMRSIALAASLLLGITGQAFAGNPVVTMKTSLGSVEIELYEDKAPNTVKNFLQYVDDDAYDGTIFHRVIKGFMNQGGGYTADGKKVETRAPIRNEADNGLKNDRGTIAMARTPDPHSATNQFFINTVDNASLNFRDPSRRNWGYAVFGAVTSGMDVMDQIAAVKTAGANKPVTPVIIESIERKE